MFVLSLLKIVKKILLPLGVVSFLVVIFLGFMNFKQQEESIRLERESLDFKLDITLFYENLLELELLQKQTHLYKKSNELLVQDKTSQNRSKFTIQKIEQKIYALRNLMQNSLSQIEKKYSDYYSNLSVFSTFRELSLKRLDENQSVEILEEGLLTKKIRSSISQLSMEAEKRLILFEEDNKNRYGVMRVTALVGSILGLFLILAFSRLNNYEFQKRVEAQEDLKKSTVAAIDLSELKSKFLATISHELRTPLNGILGTSDLLLRKLQDPTYLENVKIIHESAQGLLKIVNEILEFSKNESGQMHFEVSEFSIFDLVESSIQLFSARAKEKKITISSYIDLRLQTKLLGDAVKITQVLNNLINNAIKFTDHGEISVRVYFEGQVEDKSSIRIEVSDTGIGIESKKIPYLFQPFHQIQNKNIKKEPGTGLGLSISKQIIENLRGKIGVESELGRGSLFWFQIQLPNVNPILQAKELRPSQYTQAILFSTEKKLAENLQLFFKQIGCSFSCYSDLHEFFKQKNNFSAAEGILFLVGTGFPIEMFDQPFIKNIYFLVEEFGSKLDRPQWAQNQLLKPLKTSILYKFVTGQIRFEKISTNSSERPDLNLSRNRSEILVAEDNHTNRQVLEAQLLELGCQATLVRDGQEALKEILKKKYDLILMDCQMPVMDGFEATQNIRFHESTFGRYTPIVAMTANARQEDRDFCLSQGMDDFLPKPFVLNQLSLMIRKWIPSDSLLSVENDEDSLGLSPEVLVNVKNSFMKSLGDLKALLIEFEGKIQNFDSLNDGVNEWEQIQKWAHRLKSSAAMLKCYELFKSCEEVEFSKVNSNEERKKIIQSLLNSIDSVLKMNL